MRGQLASIVSLDSIADFNFPRLFYIGRDFWLAGNQKPMCKGESLIRRELSSFSEKLVDRTHTMSIAIRANDVIVCLLRSYVVCRAYYHYR